MVLALWNLYYSLKLWRSYTFQILITTRGRLLQDFLLLLVAFLLLYKYVINSQFDSEGKTHHYDRADRTEYENISVFSSHARKSLNNIYLTGNNLQ